MTTLKKYLGKNLKCCLKEQLASFFLLAKIFIAAAKEIHAIIPKLKILVLYKFCMKLEMGISPSPIWSVLI